jgi:hypothetical protein
VDRVKFLGFIFSAEEVGVDPQKTRIVAENPVPKTLKKLKSFLAMCSFFRRHLKFFTQKSEPLRKLLSRDVKFHWTDEQQKAFETLRQSLIKAPVLTLPDFSKNFIVATDSSTQGTAFYISQLDEQCLERVIAYHQPWYTFGTALKDYQRNYSITELECLSLILCLHDYRTYFVNTTFEWRTDHVSLRYLQSMHLGQNPRLSCWSTFLQNFKFTITYRKGKENCVADALSRIYENDSPKQTNANEDIRPQEQRSIGTQTDN